MANAELVLTLIGGLGLFFFGMHLLSDGLKQIAGDRLKNVLHMATSIPLIGVCVGAIVTCFIQSSSATTVMVVGFVNAGLLTLRQAISVVMGANIGTTFTAWLVSSMSVFKVTDYALPAVGIGFAFWKFGKTRKSRFFGQVLIGFGVLFLGLSFMKDAFDPLKDAPQVNELFIAFSNNPLLGVLIGIIFTVILQSSSATIAVVQVLAFNGLITFPAAIPIILGDNIGTTITAQLAAFGTNVTARRTAMAHTMFNVIGVGYMLVFVCLGWFERLIDFIIPGEISTTNVMFHIAVAHSSFNVLNTLIFLPFIGLLESTSVMLVKQHKGMVDLKSRYLEKHLLETPSIALEQARRETIRMLELANRSVTMAVEGVFGKAQPQQASVDQLEQAIDNLQSEITQYMIELSQQTLSEEETEEIPVVIHSVNDIERIGDHAENIIELDERKREERLTFTDSAIEGIAHMWQDLQAMMDMCKDALLNDDIELARGVLAMENKINWFQKELKIGHVDRLNRGECNMKAGVVFMDLVDNFEKIGDHLTNVAQAVIGEWRWHDTKQSMFAGQEMF